MYLSALHLHDTRFLVFPHHMACTGSSRLLITVCLIFCCSRSAVSSSQDENDDGKVAVRSELVKMEKLRNKHFVGSSLSAVSSIKLNDVAFQQRRSQGTSGSLAYTSHGDPSPLVSSSGAQSRNSAVHAAETLKEAAKSRISARLTQLIDASRASQQARHMAKDRMNERARELEVNNMI